MIGQRDAPREGKIMCHFDQYLINGLQTCYYVAYNGKQKVTETLKWESNRIRVELVQFSLCILKI